MSDENSLAEWSPEQVALGRRWAQARAEAGAFKDQLRREELRRADTVQSLQRLAGAFESARHLGKPKPSSGLVDQQALFARCRPASHG